MIRRKPSPSPDLAQKAGEVAADVLAGVLSNLRAHPITVKHEVTRNIPRPTYITVTIRDQEGREWRCPTIDASYRHSMPCYFPLSWVSGKPEDAGQQCSLNLDLNYNS